MTHRAKSDPARAPSPQRGDTGRGAGTPFQLSPSLPFYWPLVAGALAGGAMASMMGGLARCLLDQGDRRPAEAPGWETPHSVRLELQTMRLRDFSAANDGTATLICAPYALHGASVADFAPDHSLVETLLGSSIRRLCVTDWRSATPDMRFLPIDAYLADLNVAVDDLGPPVDLIGLCQGGWLALVYAARFPHKVRRMVLAGAPIDLNAAQSTVSRLAAQLPIEVFEEIVRLGDGRVLGHRVLELWSGAADAEEAARVLQIAPEVDPLQQRALEQRFQRWYDWTVDLPGTYYLQTVAQIFKQNQVAAGQFRALGRVIDLKTVRAPVFLLAARDDEWVAMPQLMATAGLVGTPSHAIKTVVVPCSHLSLFMGAQTLQRVWPWIAHWLVRDLELARAS